MEQYDLDQMKKRWNGLHNDPTALQVFASGKSRLLGSSDDRLIYYTAFDSTDVSMIKGGGSYLYETILAFLTQGGWYKQKEYTRLTSPPNPMLIDDYQVWLKEGGYMVTLSMSKNDKFDKTPGGLYVIEDYLDEISGEADVNPDAPVLVDNFEIFYPATCTNNAEVRAYIKTLTDVIQSSYYKASRAAKIGIISHDGSDFYVKNFSLSGKVPAFIHADEHYGEGFNTFHEKMITRIKEESKGLILFHGEPGTGKTQYIRMLLDILTRSKKSILYVPPSFAAQLTEPQMIEFISDWVLSEEQDCILLIEDAEPLLEIRNGSDGRSTGISNLLNMTDGILNDMLGLMVIATFNTSISKIDSALLRPKRLIARKEFCKISKSQATKLATALGVPLPAIEYPATLAEFYSDNQESTILVHSIKPERTIGFK
jgi:hypothetical protein